MKTIGVDCDQVLYDFVGAFKNFLCEERSIEPTSLMDSRRWGFFEDYGLQLWEYKEILAKGVRNNKIFWEGDAIPGAKESLERLIKNYHIVIVTHRNLLGLERTCQRATESWLKENKIPYDDLILTDEKTGLGLDLLLDDAIHNVKFALECGEKAVLYDRPGNEHAPYPRVANWEDFEIYVQCLFGPEN